MNSNKYIVEENLVFFFKSLKDKLDLRQNRCFLILSTLNKVYLSFLCVVYFLPCEVPLSKCHLHVADFIFHK